MIKKCAWCGKEFDAKHGKIKYCTPLCAKLAHNQRCTESNKRRAEAGHPLQPKTRIGVICGTEFTVGRGGSICCSDECRAENGRRHSLEYYFAHKEVKMRKCEICGTEFVAKGSMKVCGNECRQIRDKKKRQEYWGSYGTIAKQKKKEYEARLKEQQQPVLDGKVLHRAEMTVDEYNRTHGTNYSYGQYVHFVERNLI